MTLQEELKKVEQENIEHARRLGKELWANDLQAAINGLKKICSDQEVAEIIHNTLDDKPMPEAFDLEDNSHDCNLEAGHGEDGCSHPSHKDQPEQ